MDDPSLGVYAHIPFCERICPYCDFAVVKAHRLGSDAEAQVVGALLRELALRAPHFAGRRLASLYLGGGTPSLLRPESVARIVEGVRAAFPPAGPVETTLEVNPSTLERRRLPGFRAAGVGRVSVGVQSFDDGVLRRLGRAHRAAEAGRTLAASRDAGFDALSLDLIFAAPGQSPEILARDLEAALGFEPEHVSAYELTIESGTPFELASRRGQLALPGEAQVAAMFERIEARLLAAGLPRYEISSFARPGFEAVHNRRYWERRPVLGLGMGAVSTEPPREDAPWGSRRANPRALAPWLANVSAGRAPEPEVLDAPTARGEAVFLALRTVRGLDAARFAADFGAPPRGFFAPEIETLRAGGFLEEEACGDLRLTPRGRLLSDSVFAHFL